MQYDPWTGGWGFALDPPSLGITLQLVGDCGWVARLVCRAFVDASPRVTESSIDSVERLALVRHVTKWREPRDLCSFLYESIGNSSFLIKRDYKSRSNHVV